MSFSEAEHSALNTQHSKLGLLGGTFNPIHNGHLFIARHVREALDLDRVLFIPAGAPPHKPDKDLAPAGDRFEMVRLAVDHDDRLGISDVEINRKRKSYTIDTIHLLSGQYGKNTELFFVIGIDAFVEFPTWKSPDELLLLCHFVVVSRPGSTFTPLVHMPCLSSILDASPSVFGKTRHERLATVGRLDAHRQNLLDIPVPGGKSVILLDVPPCDISASDIRTRVRQGRPLANLLPPSVESYILQHHLYE
ncbi:MAG TPA: nicotinate-nucleotide adenylyltransferase [Nitrospira sp.]|nr:nicotinate-nucleotide adenylyltransferase [Nitrospira sp.]